MGSDSENYIRILTLINCDENDRGLLEHFEKRWQYLTDGSKISFLVLAVVTLLPCLRQFTVLPMCVICFLFLNLLDTWFSHFILSTAAFQAFHFN
jgi:hypothetical protein